MVKKIIFFLSLGILASLGIAVYYYLFSDLPPLDSVTEHLRSPSIRITDRYGRLLYDILPDEGGRHTVLPLESIPLSLRQATIATEDKSFYVNPGVDLRGILRALWINLRGGETIAGGSTITQQVARNFFLSSEERSERSVRRKLRETFLAWQLSHRLRKDEILALYLNQIYYGGLAYGVEAAAQTYFGKSAYELDLAESALIAGLPQAPVQYNPFTNPEMARERQRVVLELMEAQGYINSEQRLLAEREPLVFASTPYPIEAPHFVLMVRDQVEKLKTEQGIVNSGGLIVRTTLDLDWQHQAERAIRRQLEALRQQGQQHGGVTDHNVNCAALVAIDPNSGQILALVGSPDYFDAKNSGAINMVLARRQPGSAIKPIIYAAALDPSRAHGNDLPWTPAKMILDVETTFLTHDGKAYTPVNYDGLQHGPVLVRQALASSLNIPAVKSLNTVGLKTVFKLADELGITSLGDPTQYDLSLALGGGAVPLIELTTAYASFANGGYRVSPFAILEISDATGKVVYTSQEASNPAEKPRVLNERVAWLISDILSDNDARIVGFGPNSILRLDRPAAVKTGTTSNFHDNWAVGYTPELVVGVWAGNTNYEAMRDVTGLSGAAPIWAQFMRKVLSDRPKLQFKRPPGLVRVEVCALSGLLPSKDCSYHRQEWFITGTEPKELDHLYHKVWIDGATGLLANADTPAEQSVSKIVLDLPPEAHAWARIQGLILLSDLEYASATQTGGAVQGSSSNQVPGETTTAHASIRLVSPGANAIYQLAAGYGDLQRLYLQSIATMASPGVYLEEVTFWVDGEQVARLAAPPYEAWWPLVLGSHQAWVEAGLSNGQRITSERVGFEVLTGSLVETP